jgi:hypothetical protein
MDRLRQAVLGLSTTTVTSDDWPELTEADVVRAVYWAIVSVLQGRGSDPLNASKIAIRRTRALFLIEAVGQTYGEAARALSISDRTLERDLAALAELDRDAVTSPGAPSIPESGDRIAPRRAA